jgi:hypothetical protein
MSMRTTQPPVRYHRIAMETIQHIPNLDSLRKQLSEGTILVAFDSESGTYRNIDGRSGRTKGEISELGESILAPSAIHCSNAYPDAELIS